VKPYELHRYASVLAQAGEQALRDISLTASERGAPADRRATVAVQLLRRAKDTGYFSDLVRLDSVRADADLVPLRKRRDCQELFDRELPKKPM
jgi:hypothetical protein